MLINLLFPLFPESIESANNQNYVIVLAKKTHFQSLNSQACSFPIMASQHHKHQWNKM